MTTQPQKAYDQDTEDLLRWQLKQHARKLLMKVGYRQKKVRVFYEAYVELDGAYRSIEEQRDLNPLVEKYRYDPVMIQGEDGEASAIKRAVKYRVVNCTRSRINKTTQPEVWYSNKSQRASFHKLQVCGSVWTCPTCSRKINMKRQGQIAKAYELVLDGPSSTDNSTDTRKHKGDAILITFTVKHGRDDQLHDTLPAMKEAFRKMQQDWSYREWMKTFTLKKGEKKVEGRTYYLGNIIATEVTYGSNGWHPHSHQLWFFDRKLSEDEIETFRSTLFKAWKKAVGMAGFAEPGEFTPEQVAEKTYRRAGRGLGVDVRRALSAQEYLTKAGILKKGEEASQEARKNRKWTIEREMASSHTKKAKRKGKTAFELLESSMDGNIHHGLLFQEFADATLGIGQLKFSPTLNKYLSQFGFKDQMKSNEELAAELAEDASDPLGKLTDSEFETLCEADKMGESNPFGKFLHTCKHDGFDAAISWLNGLRKDPFNKEGKKRAKPERKKPRAKAVHPVIKIRAGDLPSSAWKGAEFSPPPPPGANRQGRDHASAGS